MAQEINNNNRKLRSIYLLIWLIVMGILLFTLFSSCYSEKKAIDQMNKGLSIYPDTAHSLFRNKFPCIITSIDSSEFLKSKVIADSLIEILAKNKSAADIRLTKEYKDRIKKLTDSFQLQVSETGQTVCDSINGQILDFATQMEIKNNDLQQKTDNLKTALKNIKPVINKIEDNSKIDDLARHVNKVNAELKLKDDKLVTCSDELSAFKKKKKQLGTLAIWFGLALITKWWFYLVLGFVINYFTRGKVLRIILSIFNRNK